MIAKELRDAKWKALPGLVIPLFIALSLAFSGTDVDSANVAHRLRVLSAVTSQPVSLYDSSVWVQTFTFSTGLQFLPLVLAAVLGAGLIAGESTRGTIFFLLSRPASRDRLLLMKHAVSAALLLGLVVLIGVAALVIPAAYGHPQRVGGVAVSVVLFWLETVFVLGVALACSVIMKDTLRALLVALLTVIMITNLPSIIAFILDHLLGSNVITGASARALSLGVYWSSLDAFAGNSFPAQSLLIAVIAAAIPLIVAIALFRRRAY